MKKNNKKPLVFIPNATSPKNIGDLAILESLISLVKSNLRKTDIYVQSVDPHLYKKTKYAVNDTLYSWSVLSTSNTIRRIFRLLSIIFIYLALRTKLNVLRFFPAKLQRIITDYQQADTIIFVGGGYLRSTKGLKQSLNLCMQLLPFVFAKLFHAERIVAPISFGPFAQLWQEKLSAKVLDNFNLVCVREKISLKILKKYHIDNAVLSSDHALLLNRDETLKKQRGSGNHFTIGFTIRSWGQPLQQNKLEAAIIETFENISKTISVRIQPIVQVDAPKYGEGDKEVTKRIVKKLMQRRNTTVLPIKTITSISEAVKIYASLDLLLGMRMHSNIIAATQGTPFVGIAYEHKTKGIAKQLAMEKYCIKSENVDSENLYRLFIDAYTNRNNLKHTLIHSIKTIQDNEMQKWNYYLSK